MAYCEGSRPIVFRCHTCGHIVETNWHEGRRRTFH
jgi:DNA-directed RNA polymerase subunit N (RpoN/RPB10)